MDERNFKKLTECIELGFAKNFPNFKAPLQKGRFPLSTITVHSGQRLYFVFPVCFRPLWVVAVIETIEGCLVHPKYNEDQAEPNEGRDNPECSTPLLCGHDE